MTQKDENTMCLFSLMWLAEECDWKDIRDIVTPERNARAGEIVPMVACYEYGDARALYIFDQLVAVIDVAESDCYDLRAYHYKVTPLNTLILNEFITTYGAVERFTYRPI